MPITQRLRRYPIIRHIVIRPRPALALVMAVVVYAVVPEVVPLHWQVRWLVAYDAGVVLYLALAGHVMATAIAMAYLIAGKVDLRTRSPLWA